MGCFNIELNRVGNTPTPTIERVGATPTAEVEYLGGVPIASLIGLGDTPTAVLEHLGGITVSGSLLCYVGNDTLAISETSLSFTNEEVGTTKMLVVFATSEWEAEIIDTDGLFQLSRNGGAGGLGTKIGITLTKVNPNVYNYSATVVFKSRGLRRTLGLVAEASEATYTPLTYIEATGEQYIDLEYVVKETDTIEMHYESMSSESKDKILFGAVGGGGYIWFSLYGNTAYMRFGHTASTSVSNATESYMVKMSKGAYALSTGSGTLGYTSMPTTPLFLFARGTNGITPGAYGVCRCTYFAITDGDGNKVMELTPHKRNSDGVIGMLDSVSGTFYASDSDTDFLGGAEIHLPKGYAMLPYVAFAKDKLFDAGIIKNTHTIETMYAKASASGAEYLYGVVTSDNTASVTAYLVSGGIWRFGSSYSSANGNNTNIHKAKMSSGTFVFDATKKTFAKSTFTTPDTVVLGGYRAASGALTRNFQGRVYFFRITEGDSPIIDYHPCKRISDGAEGFWDCVTQTFIESI